MYCFFVIIYSGTFGWTAPEMNDMEENTNLIDFSADIWSIGLLIIYMINCGNLGLMEGTKSQKINSMMIIKQIKNVESKEQYLMNGEDKFGEYGAFDKEIRNIYKDNKMSDTLFNYY